MCSCGECAIINSEKQTKIESRIKKDSLWDKRINRSKMFFLAGKCANKSSIREKNIWFQGLKKGFSFPKLKFSSFNFQSSIKKDSLWDKHIYKVTKMENSVSLVKYFHPGQPKKGFISVYDNYVSQQDPQIFYKCLA